MTTDQPPKRIGRPPGTKRTDLTATIPPVRCEPQQRKTFDGLGGPEWLRGYLDRAAKRMARG